VSGAAFDSRGALEAVDRILNRGGEPIQVLSEVLEAIHARGVPFARIRFVADGDLVDGIVVGSEAPAKEAEITVRGERVGTLEIAADDLSFIERVATVVSAVSAKGAKHFRQS
jgi:hypothetical protein